MVQKMFKEPDCRPPTFEIFGRDDFGRVDKLTLVGVTREIAEVAPEVGHASGASGQDGRRQVEVGVHVPELLQTAAERRRPGQVGTDPGQERPGLRRGLHSRTGVGAVQNVDLVVILRIRTALAVPDTGAGRRRLLLLLGLDQSGDEN